METIASTDMLAQLRKGVIQHCLLAMLEAEPCHGYELVARLSRTKMIALAESTVYPALARLKAKGLVEHRSAPSERGPERKVFVLTEEGRALLATWRACWSLFAREVDAITEGRRHDDGVGSETTAS